MTDKEVKKLRNQLRMIQKLGLPADINIYKKVAEKKDKSR